jgi:hypothetical protein
VGEEREVEENGGEEREGKEMDRCPLTGSAADYLLHHMTVTIMVTVSTNTTSKYVAKENRE